MGHRKTMVMLVITRGYIFFYFASKAMNLSTDQDWVARISHVVPERQEVAARRNGSCESIVSLRRCRAQIWKAVQWLRKKCLLESPSKIESNWFNWDFPILFLTLPNFTQRIKWIKIQQENQLGFFQLPCWLDSLLKWKSCKSFFGAPRYVCGFDVYKYDSEPSNRFQPYRYMIYIYIYVSYTSILGLYM